MVTANDRLRKQAKKVTKDLREMRGTAKDAAREMLRQIHKNGSQRYEQGAAKCNRPREPSSTLSNSGRSNPY